MPRVRLSQVELVLLSLPPGVGALVAMEVTYRFGVQVRMPQIDGSWGRIGRGFGIIWVGSCVVPPISQIDAH